VAMQVNFYEAKAQVSAVLVRALADETVVIVRAGKPMASWTPILRLNVGAEAAFVSAGSPKSASNLRRIFARRVVTKFCWVREAMARYPGLIWASGSPVLSPK